MSLLFVFAWANVSLNTGCTNPPSQRVLQVQTLKGVGATVDAGMKLAGRLYHDGKITEVQKAKIIELHGKFQLAYGTAVDAVTAELGSGADHAIASEEISTLAADLLSLIESFQKVNP